ncbi:MAG: phosphoglycerate kinase, partial [Candidatus Krumholzibacteria bacterium]|nr:phosphoglycerate kinase [Candidatus Krumholzibacteria bacterium]
MRKKTLRDVELDGKRVLMRVDFNTPLTKDGDVDDDTRIRAALPTINYIAEHGASLVLISHLGRPKGKRVSSMSLKVVAYRLAELVHHPIRFAEDCIGDQALEMASALAPGEILLLENLRFYDEETSNDQGFARKLSRYGDIYVNDAFGTAHRAHASTEGVTHFFEERVAGMLMEKELETLDNMRTDPKRPFVAVLGGAKVSGKIGLIRNLLDKVDRILVGGGMAFTFFKALGLEIGDSLLDESYMEMCRETMEKAGSGSEKRIFLPVDCIVAKEITAGAEHRVVSTGDIPEDWAGVDIGEKTVEIFGAELRGAKTIFWNGPMGV